MSTNCVQCVTNERTGVDLLCDGCRRTNALRDIEKRFTYHPPKGDQAQRYEQIRVEARSMAVYITDLCPNSREKSLALTKLEECIFWSNASIARNE